MSELLPCPFCGGNAALSWDDTSKLSFGECIECGTESGHAENYDNAKAVEQWNKRSPDLLPPLTASIAIVADRDRYKRERNQLATILNRYTGMYPAFRIKPEGAPGSQARDEQERKMALEDEAIAALSSIKP